MYNLYKYFGTVRINKLQLIQIHMGLFSFIKDAGQNLFGKEAEAGEYTSKNLGPVIEKEFTKYNVPGPKVSVNGSTVTLSREVMNETVRKRAIIIAGNVKGVEKVDDQMRYQAARPTESQAEAEPEVPSENEFYTVQSGDTLSGIAKEIYGDPMKYPEIFEANKPMLSDPDKIYPGQKLIIPKL